jgi:hypothetical protein
MANAPQSIICPNPNCGYTGPPERKARGSIVIAILLFLFGVIPGVLYLLLAGGYDYYCPKCHLKLPGNLIAL